MENIPLPLLVPPHGLEELPRRDGEASWKTRPLEERGRSRSASSRGSVPRATEIRAAAAMPMLTASPWGSPTAFSRACPRVCPKLSLRLSPASSSSASTNPALIRTDPSRTRRDRPPVQGKERRFLRFEDREQVFVGDEGVLDDLGQAAQALPGGQGLEERQVDEDVLGLTEDARDILHPPDVDAVLSSDGGVRLGQERGRHETESDAPHVGRGREPGEVADDPAADPGHEGRAVELEPQEFPVDPLHGPEGLARLPRA